AEAPPTFSNRAVRLAAFFQIALVIFFGAPEFRSRFYLRHEWPIKFATLTDLFFRRFGDGFLLRRMIKNHRAILPADVWALSIERGRIVVRPKNVKKLFVFDLRRIEFQLNDLGVAGLVAADIFVSR